MKWPEVRALQNLLAFALFVLSPAFAGLKIFVFRYLGLAPQALCSRLLRRLKADFGDASKDLARRAQPKG